MRADIHASLKDVPAEPWNALGGVDAYPFLRHEFFRALEDSGCVGPGTGWQGSHLLLHDDGGELLGALPLYLKTNSYGEFVFDWSWADAYRRAGLRYFPKLVSAVPYTPATSPRFLIAPGRDADTIVPLLLKAALTLGKEVGASSLHLLFPTAGDTDRAVEAGMLRRKDCQFHWHNQGYSSFDQFLGEFTAEKRKKAKRERRRVREAGIEFRHLAGNEIDAGLWEQLMPLYASSFWRRGREPYLNQAFFMQLARTLPESLLAIVAFRGPEPVATALCYKSRDTLYGRYWGSSGDYHSLHFETCYYQGIEHCIDAGLQRFEPGTQGEHKISRGFVPTEVWSTHWLSHPQFAAAVDEYLDREREHMDRYIDEVREHVPYRKGGGDG